MPLLGEMSVKIGADISNFQSGMKTVKSDLSNVKTSTDDTGGGFKNLISTIGGVAVGGAIIGGVSMAVGALGGFLSDSVSQASDAALGQAQLAQAIKSTGDVSGVTVQHANELADSLSQVTTFSDDTTRTAENMLLTFTNIGAGGGIFDRTTQTALDMSQALGQDVKSSAMQLGKALDDPVKGMSALQRVGVTFSDGQKTLIANFEKTGQTAKAQTVILDELQKEFGGSAKAAGDTFPGKLAILNNQFDQVKQTVGGAIIPIFSQLLTAAMPVFTFLAAQLPGAIATAQAWFTKIADFIENNIEPAFHSVSNSGLIGDLRDTGQVIASDFLPFIQKAADVFTNTLLPTIQAFIPHLAQLGGVLSTGEQIATAFLVAFVGIGTAIATNVLPIIQVLIPIIGQLAGFIVDKLAAGFAYIAPYLFQAAETLQQFATVINEKAAPAVKVIADLIKTDAAIIGAVWNALWPTMSAVLAGAWQVIVGVVQVAWSLVSGIISIGLDLISGNWSGVWHDIQNMFAGVWSGIQSILSGNVQIITGLVSGLVHGVSSLFYGVWGGLAGFVGGIFGGIVTSIETPINQAKAIVSAGLNAISGFFAGLHIQFPHINLPHFSISGTFSAIPPSVPSFDIKWYANGGIFNSPSVIGVGEAGPEAVVPLNKLDGMGGGYRTANIMVMLDSYMLMQAMGQQLVDFIRLQTGAKI